MDLQSGMPYWLIKNGMPYHYPKLENNCETEVAIIGGGISGALVAYYLVSAGVKCVILDRRSIGLGSTCASTSLLQYEIDVALSELKNKVGIDHAVRAYKLCDASIQKLYEVSKVIGFTDFQFRQSLYYSATKKDLSFLKDEYDIRHKKDFDVTLITGKEVKEKYGFSAEGAILSQSGAKTNAYGFAHFLHQYNIKNHGQVYERTFVKNIDHQLHGIKLKTDDGYTITAKKLVYANGYESVNYIKKNIVKLNSTYAIISESSDANTNYWLDDVLIWNTDDPYLYLRTTDDGRILIGGRDEKFYDPEKRDRVINEKAKQLSKDFNKLFPGIPFKEQFSWAGTFGSTKDGLPFIGEYKKLPNSYFALGFGGNGITFSLIAAEIITGLFTTGSHPDEELFSFDRM